MAETPEQHKPKLRKLPARSSESDSEASSDEKSAHEAPPSTPGPRMIGKCEMKDIRSYVPVQVDKKSRTN